MRYMYRFFTALALTLSFAGTVSAQSAPSVQVATAYNKGNNNYDVVVKDPAGIKLRLYVNDKNPVSATGNKNRWATFHKVPLKGHGKLSFTQVVKRHNGSTYETPLNYTSSYTTDRGKVSFGTLSSTPPRVVVTPAPVVVTPNPQPVQSTPQPTAQVVPQPAEQASPVVNTGTTDANLSNTNTYTNVDGNTVHSPAASTDGSVPAGATAMCSDGTYSFSQHHSGTCSHHGGVSQWLQ